MRSKPVTVALVLVPMLASALVVVLAAASCGGGSAKLEFDKYERAVNPILEEEEKLRDRFDEEVQNAIVYQDEKKVAGLVKRKLVPHYRKMEVQVEGIEPEGEDLREIHPLLIRYVELRLEFLDLYEKLGEIEKEGQKRQTEAEAKIDEAFVAITKKGIPLKQAFEADQQAGMAFFPLLQQEVGAGQEFRGLATALADGRVRSATFLEHLDTRYKPFYAEVLKKVQDVAETDANRAVRKATIEYLETAREYLESTRDLARVRVTIEQEIDPVGERIQQIQKDARDQLETYKTEARKYRESLR